MLKKVFVFLSALLFLQASGQEKWSLQRCVEYALKNNISVKQSDVQARLSRITAMQSAMTRIPNLSGSLSSGYSHGLTTNPTTNILQSANFLSGSMNVQASYNVFTWNARKNTIAANNLLLKADEVGIDKAKNDISLTIANAYLQVMLRREQARISEVQVNQSRAQLSNTLKLVNAGSQPELNAIQLEAQLAKDSSSLLQSQALTEEALINLKAYMNFDFSLPFDIETPVLDQIPIENITELQPENVYKMALATQPLQQMYRLRIDAANKQIKAARGYMYPALIAYGGVTSSAINVKYPQMVLVEPQSTSAYITVGSEKYTVYAPSYKQVGLTGIPLFTQVNQNFGQNVGLSISFSLFNGYTYRTQWERAKVNVAQLTLQNEQDDLTLKTNIYNAYQDAYSSLQKYYASQRTVAYSQRALDISKKRFDIGLLGSLEYIITQNNLYLAQIDEVSNHYDFVFKMKVLEFYKGQGVKF